MKTRNITPELRDIPLTFNPSKLYLQCPNLEITQYPYVWSPKDFKYCNHRGCGPNCVWNRLEKTKENGRNMNDKCPRGFK